MGTDHLKAIINKLMLSDHSGGKELFKYSCPHRYAGNLIIHVDVIITILIAVLFCSGRNEGGIPSCSS